MERGRIGILLLALTALVFVSCEKKPVFSLVPQISFLDMQPSLIRSFKDSVIVSISFTDGDGDVGNIDGDNTEYLLLYDTRYRDGLYPDRESAKIGYQLPNLTADASRPSIRGEIYVKIPRMLHTPGEDTTYMTFEIELYDRAGNKSVGESGNPDEPVETSILTIVRQ